MLLYRFMSLVEFNKFIKDEELINTNEHRGKYTDSIGFCFGKCGLLDEPEIYPKYDWQYLEGVFDKDPEVCCIFETDSCNVKEGYGIYADPYGSFWDTMQAKEYSCTNYSRKNFKLIKYCTNFKNFYNWSDNADWEWINYG